MIRVVLDTNVVVSGMIVPLGTSAAILDAWRDGSLEVVTCPVLLAEIDEKLRLPRIRTKYPITDAEVVNLLLRFSQAAHLVPGRAPVNPAPPDPDDVMLFSAAIESNADYIVTEDKALQQFDWQGQGRIISPRQFCEIQFPHRLASE